MTIYKKNPKKLKLLMLTDGNLDQASARIRAIQYIPMLEESGYSVKLIPRIGLLPHNLIRKYICSPVIKRVLWMKRYFAIWFVRWDIVFVQRSFIDQLSLRRITSKSKLIFDFDDAIYIGEKSPLPFRSAANMVRFAHKVIISTPLLNEFCNKCGKNGIVIPTPIESDLIIPSPKMKEFAPVIGWIGSSWTTPYLDLLTPVLQNLSEKIEFEFITVGVNPKYLIPGVNHKNFTWEFGIESIALSKMDIGIMPLPDNEYATAKGGYKLYLYMAAGIPCVASPVGINSQIIEHGENGFLANTPSEWSDSLKILLEDKALRMKMGINGRNQAVTLYDRKICFSKLIKIIEENNI